MGLGLVSFFFLFLLNKCQLKASEEGRFRYKPGPLTAAGSCAATFRGTLYVISNL